MRPGEGLGRDLGSVLLVDLLVDSAVIVLDVRVNSSKDGITSRLGGSHKVGSSGVLTKVEDLLPCFVVLISVIELEVAVSDHTSLHSTCSVVEKFSKGSGEELPGVSVGIMVTRVSSNQNSRNLSSIIDSVDVVLVAEDIDVVGDSSSSLFGERTVHFIGEGGNCVDSGSINSMSVVGVSVIRFSQVSAVPVLAEGASDGVGSVLVRLSVTILANRGSEICSSSKGVDIAHASPEEVGVSSFFPEITAILLPVLSNPVQVVLDEGPDIVGSLILASSLDKDSSVVR